MIAQPGYRNGYGRERRFTLSLGTVEVRRPRVRNAGEHGLASGYFELALRGLLGQGAPLSSSSLGRLKEKWEVEYEQRKGEPIKEEELSYQWADGIYVKAGVEDSKAALLVMVGALKDGRKVVLAVDSGQRESKESRARVLRDLRARGLRPWRATVADGHLGIWGTLGEIFPESEDRRCWIHRLINMIDQLPKKVWPEAEVLLRKIPYAESRRECERLCDQFIARYGRLYPKAAETLCRDWERMVTFYRFPKEHWRHLRTTNVVESPFAAVRLRTDAAKCYKKVAHTEALIWGILMIAEKKFRRLNAPHLLEEVYKGKKFADGVVVKKVNRRLAA